MKRVNTTFSFKRFFTFLLLDLNIGQKNEIFSRKLFTLFQISCLSEGAYNQTLHYVKCQLVNVIRTRERLSTYSFDTMKLKVLFLLNCESSKYIAKLFYLSI